MHALACFMSGLAFASVEVSRCCVYISIYNMKKKICVYIYTYVKPICVCIYIYIYVCMYVCIFI